MTRVLLAEDQAMVRGALVSLLGSRRTSRSWPRSGAATRCSPRRAAPPEVALLDIGLPGHRRARGRRPPARRAARRARDHAHHVQPARATCAGRWRRGAAGFLLKDAPASELARAIRAAAAGQRVVDPGLAAAALSQGENPLTAARAGGARRRPRRYGTVAELAAALHLSQGTVRNHLSAIMQKLDVHSRIEAIRVAEERGWL